MKHRVAITKSAYRMARGFGRSVAVSALLAGRMLMTGRTGRYRIKSPWPITTTEQGLSTAHPQPGPSA